MRYNDLDITEIIHSPYFYYLTGVASFLFLTYLKYQNTDYALRKYVNSEEKRRRISSFADWMILGDEFFYACSNSYKDIKCACFSFIKALQIAEDTGHPHKIISSSKKLAISLEQLFEFTNNIKYLKQAQDRYSIAQSWGDIEADHQHLYLQIVIQYLQDAINTKQQEAEFIQFGRSYVEKADKKSEQEMQFYLRYAYRCFNYALDINPDCKEALYELGKMAEKNEDTLKGIKSAKYYYSEGIRLHDPHLVQRLIYLEHQDNINSETYWPVVAQSYYFQASISKNANFKSSRDTYFKAFIAFKVIVNHKSEYPDVVYKDACFKLGEICEKGLGGKVDKQAALAHYQNAYQLGNLDVGNAIVRLKHPLLNEDYEWFQQGQSYYYDNHNPQKNKLCAAACYVKALECNPQHADSLYSLGFMYERGQGVLKDLDKAKQYYYLAMKQSDLKAKQQLIQLLTDAENSNEQARAQVFTLEHDHLKTVEQWYALGEKNYYGWEGYEENFFNAYVSYLNAIEIDENHMDSQYRLGYILEHGKGALPKNYQKAREYYQKALDLGHQDAAERLKGLSQEKIDQKRKLILSLGAAKAVAGVGFSVLTGGWGATLGGGYLMGSGMSSLSHSIFAADETITVDEYCSRSITGGITSVVMRGAISLVRAGGGTVNLLSREGASYVMVDGAIGVTANCTARVATNLIFGRPVFANFSARDLLFVFITGAAASATSLTLEPVFETINASALSTLQDIQWLNERLTYLCIGMATGGGAGMSTAATACVVSNWLSAKNQWNEGLCESLMAGFLNGSLNGACNGLQRYKQLQAKIAEFREILSSDIAEELEQCNLRLNQVLLKIELQHRKLLKEAVDNYYRFKSGPKKGQRITENDIEEVIQSINQGETIVLKQKGKKGQTTGRIELSSERFYKKEMVKNGKRVTNGDPVLIQLKVLQEQVDKVAVQLRDNLNNSGFDGDKILVEYLKMESIGFIAQRKQAAKNNRNNLIDSHYKGIDATFIKDLFMDPECCFDITKDDNIFTLLRDAFDCSNQCYQNETGGKVEEMRTIAHLRQTENGLDLFVYAKPSTNQLFFAFKGSQKAIQWIKEDLLLGNIGKPGAVGHTLKHQIQRIINQYPGADIIFTGHSLGGALASWASSEFQLPAICWDNPGMVGIDGSLVLSLQSLPNLVNQLSTNVTNRFVYYFSFGMFGSETSPRNFEKGYEVFLAPPRSHHLLYNKVTFNIYGCLPGHRMVYIERAFERTVRLLRGESQNAELSEYIRTKSSGPGQPSNQIADLLHQRILRLPSNESTQYSPLVVN